MFLSFSRCWKAGPWQQSDQQIYNSTAHAHHLCYSTMRPRSPGWMATRKFKVGYSGLFCISTEIGKTALKMPELRVSTILVKQVKSQSGSTSNFSNVEGKGVLYIFKTVLLLHVCLISCLMQYYLMVHNMQAFFFRNLSGAVTTWCRIIENQHLRSSSHTWSHFQKRESWYSWDAFFIVTRDDNGFFK